MTIQSPRGTEDLLPEVTYKWQAIEEKLRHLATLYNYKEIRTPMFESTELFQRGVGETTDIVQKEMYTFEDRSGRSLTLRPEGTASVVRSYVQHKLHGASNQPTKLYYMGPMFRYERPQQGRMRQFHQFGIEAIGSEDPAIDAEVIAFAMDCYTELGLKSLKLVINSIGDGESRLNHREALIKHFEPVKNELCNDCKERLEKNPLRVLDCKVDADHEAVKTAPSILDYLNDESKQYFDGVKAHLDEMGIKYVVDDKLVRGLDYYTHTAFEIMSEAEGFGAITTLTGGGRYNGLVQDLGGPESSGIGFAFSVERLLMALEAENIVLQENDAIDCFVIAIGDKTKTATSKLVYELRKAGIRADQDYLDRKIKGQFKQAERLNASFAIIVGENELQSGVVNIKNLKSGDEETIRLDESVRYVEAQLKEEDQ